MRNATSFKSGCKGLLLASSLALSALSAVAQNVCLQISWDASTDPDVNAYTLYWGEAGSPMTNSLTVSGQTHLTLCGLSAGKSYFAQATAKSSTGLESVPSNLLACSAPTPVSTVVGARLFYNHSAFDNNDASANVADDAAIATDKTPLRPGATATFANYSSYSRGLNGVMIDFSSLPGTPTASDFTFKIGNDNTPSDWTQAPLPSTLAVRTGAGLYGSDRLTLIWPDNAIQKTWLEVTVLPSANTGLTQPYTFYFGNAIGEAGNNPADAKVDMTDVFSPRANQQSLLNPATLTNLYDYNRDQRVDVADMLIARANQTTVLNALQLLNLSQVSVSSLAANTVNGTKNVALQSTVDTQTSQTGAAAVRIVQSSLDAHNMHLTLAGLTQGQAVKIKWTPDLNMAWQELPAHWVATQDNGLSEVQVPMEVGASKGFFAFESVSNRSAQ